MTLFFMHLTKTAGGSVKQMVRESGANVLMHYQAEKGFRSDFSYDSSPEILFGHYRFGVHEKMGKTPRYACFVREPVARSVSHYHHLKNNDRGPVGNRLRSFPTMADFFSKARHWEFDNFLCRQISGVENTVGFGEVNHNIYAKARDNLRNHFEFVGIFEELASSLERLRRLIPSLPADPPIVNRGTYSKELLPGERQAVQEFNVFDQLLYRDAVALATD